MKNELRPESLKDLIGQTDILDRIGLIIKSAQSRSAVMDHMLLYGCRGTGKTTIANCIANEMGCEIQVANGANLNSIKRLLPYIGAIKENSILFIDEIHRLPTSCQEFLYPVVEDYRLDIKKDETTKIELDIPKFTLIGATTDYGQLTPPMIDRFTYKMCLQKYSEEELSQLIFQNSSKLGVDITEKQCIIIAEVSRGIPRVANSYLKSCRDYIVANSIQKVTSDIIKEALNKFGVYQEGLVIEDIQYLDALRKFGKPVGIQTLVSTLDIDKETIEHTIEPYLLQKGMIVKTSKGRIINGNSDLYKKATRDKNLSRVSDTPGG